MKLLTGLFIAILPFSLIGQAPEECRALIKFGALDRANSCLQTSAQTGASNPGYLYTLAKYYDMIQNDDSAAIILNKAKSLAPDNNFTRLTDLMILLHTSQTDKATGVAAILLESSKTESVEFFNELGKLMTHPRLAATALPAEFGNRFKIKATEQSPDYHLYMGDFYTSKSDFGAAVNEYNTILDKDPKNIFALYGKSESYKKIKNYKSALDEINSALAITPEFPLGIKQKAELLFSLGNTQEGIAAYNKYFTYASRDIKTRNQYAVQLYTGKLYQEALDQSAVIFKADSANAQALKIKAYAEHELGKYEESIATFDRFITSTDTSLIVSRDYEYLAKNYTKLNNDTLAMLNYSKAIELPNAPPELFTDLGAQYQKKGMYKEAVNVFRKKMGTSTLTVGDYYNFGRALLGDTSFAEADSMFAKVTELQPEWPNGHFMRANANANLDPESTQGLAKPHYEKFIELTEKDTATAAKYSKNLIEAYKYLGYYYFLNKDLPASKSYWSKVLLIDPKDKVAQEAIKKL